MYYSTKNNQIKDRKLVEMNSTLMEQQNQTITPEKLGIFGNYSRHWEPIGVEKFTPHDLRRTCRTGLATLKVSDIVAEKILSHSLQGVLGVYNRATYEPERRAALNLWENHILSLINPAPENENKNITDLNSYRAVKM